MRRAMLFYNPHSGQRRANLGVIVAEVAALLREAGVEASVSETSSAAEAGQQARDAVEQGFDTIFACGGDGTIQDVAQGLIGTTAALAVIPLGTANVLAHDLGIPGSALVAARAALQAVPLRVNVGRIECRNGEGNIVTRYFLSVAGAGQDGYLFQRLGTGDKRTFGIAAYLLKALQVWLTHRPEWFSASVSTGPPEQVTQLLAVRLENFGNVLRNLATGASLLQEDFRVVLFKSSSRWRYLLFVLRGVLGAHWAVPGVVLRRASRITCTSSASGNPVFAEADGELLGVLPAEISIVPDALTLLVPKEFASSRQSQAP